MWFKLANASFKDNNLGKMSTLSNSISITYNSNNGFSAAAGSSAVLKADSSKKLTLNLLSGWTCDRTPTVTVTKATGSNVSYNSGTLEFTITPSDGKSTFGETDAVSSGISISISGAVNNGGSGGGEPETPVNPPSGGGGGEPSNPTPGSAWLSVLLTGDADAHNKFMNGTLTGAGSLANGRDVIYTTSQIQSLLVGKKIYKIASNGLNENTLTLYSNPWKGDNSSNTTDGRTAVGTVTSTSAQAAGTIVEYSVSNPSAIKDNETLSIGWTGPASGIKTVKNYNTSVYYLNPVSSTTFTSKLSSFCSFDFYVGE